MTSSHKMIYYLSRDDAYIHVDPADIIPRSTFAPIDPTQLLAASKDDKDTPLHAHARLDQRVGVITGITNGIQACTEAPEAPPEPSAAPPGTHSEPDPHD